MAPLTISLSILVTAKNDRKVSRPTNLERIHEDDLALEEDLLEEEVQVEETQVEDGIGVSLIGPIRIGNRRKVERSGINQIMEETMTTTTSGQEEMAPLGDQRAWRKRSSLSRRMSPNRRRVVHAISNQIAHARLLHRGAQSRSQELQIWSTETT